MNIKKNYLILYICINIILIFFINIRNLKRVNINIFTWQLNNNSIGKIITYSYIAGISFNTLLTLLVINNESRIKTKLNEEELFNKSEGEDEITYDEKFIEKKPPERDLKESQPTISVNYRVIDNNNYSSDRNDIDKNFRTSNDTINNDWGENDKDW